MSREKQIEEMAKDICRVKQSCNDVCHPINSCRALKYAERFYNAGYRKQSEGEWQDFSDKYDKGMDLRCSVCGKRASAFVGGTEDWWDLWKPNYCPHCGAKMKGGE